MFTMAPPGFTVSVPLPLPKLIRSVGNVLLVFTLKVKLAALVESPSVRPFIRRVVVLPAGRPLRVKSMAPPPLTVTLPAIRPVVLPLPAPDKAAPLATVTVGVASEPLISKVPALTLLAPE